MWRTSGTRAYPFRRHHENHFPPSSSIGQNSIRSLPVDVPIVYSEDDHEMSHRFQFPAAHSNLLTPEPKRPRPLHIYTSSDMQIAQTQPMPPPTPSSVAPLHLTNLLQEVLFIMNALMLQHDDVQQESEMLRYLTELVVIMQEEAETLVSMADLVKEYVDELEIAEQAADIQEWVDDLDLNKIGKSPKIGWGGGWKETRGGRKARHDREDSGVGLEEDDSDTMPALRRVLRVVDSDPVEERGMLPPPIVVRKKSTSSSFSSPPTSKSHPSGPPPTPSKPHKPVKSYAMPTIASKMPSQRAVKKTSLSFRDSALDLRSPRRSPTPRSRQGCGR